jgi:hypothetical protein
LRSVGATDPKNFARKGAETLAVTMRWESRAELNEWDLENEVAALQQRADGGEAEHIFSLR